MERFVEHFTYAGVFLLLVLGSLGLPVPEEVPILAGGVFAHQGIVRWWIMLPVCIAGALSGDCLLYWIGRRWGEDVLRLRLVRRLLTAEREALLREAYRRNGVKIVAGARHVMGLRAPAFLAAGIADIPFWKFAVVDGAAACVGVPIGFLVAFLLSDHLTEIMRDVRRIERWIGLLVLVALGAWWFLGVRRRAGSLG